MMVMSEDSPVDVDDSMGARVRGGAAVGAGFGAILGAVIGWLLGAQVTAVPTIGPVVGDWVLPSMLVGLGVGAGIGALVGALAAIATTSQGRGGTPGGVEEVGIEDYGISEGVLQSDGTALSEAQDSLAVPEAGVEVPVAEQSADAGVGSSAGDRAVDTDVENVGPLSASSNAEETFPKDVASASTEETNVIDNQEGRNPNTFTGTQDAIDSETGALGTAGTPVTTGYGVSGSTVGTGTRRKRKKQESEDFRGANPDSVPYEVGGRASGDAGVLEGAERDASVVDENSDADRVEANIPREAETRDIYEQGEGYAENLERDTTKPVRKKRSAKASAGTNIPGTDDPSGLGDNTDGGL